MVVMQEDDYLEHYGVLRRSGRYPWGSSSSQNVRNRTFLEILMWWRKEGVGDTDIARFYGMTTTQLRAANTIASNQQKQARINQAQKLKDKGLSNVAIGEKMGINESTVRALLAPGAADKANMMLATANRLKEEVAEKNFLDVGTGVESHLGITDSKLKVAVAMLQEEGYEVHTVNIRQLGTDHETKVKVLAPPGTTQKEVWEGRHDIQQVVSWSEDGGRSWFGLVEPLSIDESRVDVVYAKDGGTEADGVVYVREGVDDLSLGGQRYAQVRIKVGEGHYIKGMAIYKDDMPEGVDLLFNTNKDDTGNKLDALKELERTPEGNIDPDNPFGAQIKRQIGEGLDGPDPKLTSAVNLVNEAGDWGRWSQSIASQVLSKQSPTLAKQQLAMTRERRQAELDEILTLTNPTVKAKLLETFADSTDSASVHLKAAALPRQGWHAIMPSNSLPETQIYAPNFRDGEQVALIRYPHGGTFEIPDLTVNNSHAPSKRLLGSDTRDAVGINAKVAERLSGADFDGDTVLVIPNSSKKIKSSRALEGLKDFDPKRSYPPYEGMKRMTARVKGLEMGNVSNLITDMTIQGAPPGDIARAVRHSMVVIDAEKHGLDWRSSARDNGITALKAQYQGGGAKGASTIISRASSEVRVDRRKARTVGEGGPIDKVTGEKRYEPTGESYTTRDGERVTKTQRSEKLAETNDAFTLVSKGSREATTPIERVYADHSNSLKKMANTARLELLSTPTTKRSPSAAKAYEKEVGELDAQLRLLIRNRPLERQAQVVAGSIVTARKRDNPGMDLPTEKKISRQALAEARTRTGAAEKSKVVFTPRQWEAIQAGAISQNKLKQLLDGADLDAVKELATPAKKTLMTPARSSRAQSMLASGASRAEVAAALGVSLTTLDRELYGEGG